jgi:hypothetical protein
MKVLAFLMGRRRKVMPKAMRKNVLMLVLQLLDLTNPSEVAIAVYMSKNLVHGRRAADEFLRKELVSDGDEENRPHLERCGPLVPLC